MRVSGAELGWAAGAGCTTTVLLCSRRRANRSMNRAGQGRAGLAADGHGLAHGQTGHQRSATQSWRRQHRGGAEGLARLARSLRRLGRARARAPASLAACCTYQAWFPLGRPGPTSAVDRRGATQRHPEAPGAGALTVGNGRTNGRSVDDGRRPVELCIALRACWRAGGIGEAGPWRVARGAVSCPVLSSLDPGAKQGMCVA